MRGNRDRLYAYVLTFCMNPTSARGGTSQKVGTIISCGINKGTVIFLCNVLTESKPFPLLHVGDKKYRVRTVFPGLHNHRQFNEWKWIYVFEMSLFLRRWSHVVSSRLYVIHRTEQPIHSGVASNHGSYKLCFHMRWRFEQVYIPPVFFFRN
jgi:hypothetical protein